MNSLIGREIEKIKLKGILSSKSAEFLAIYGRRRVGKTLLIREFCKDKGIFLEVTGTYQGNMSDQLTNFVHGFTETFKPSYPIASPNSWHEAFELLTKTVQAISKNKKIILFFDELPWLASKRSKLINHLDYYWNRYWSRMTNLTLIVCGSAASWILDNIINNKGGLHNRVTHSILLQPFDLVDTANFLKAYNVNYTKKQMLDIYMVMGGIPHYLKQINRSKSVVQNINEICFSENGLLSQEFNRLFKSLFHESDAHEKIIKVLAESPMGLTLKDISIKTKIKKGGRLSKRLDELSKAGFIKKFTPLEKSLKNSRYRIIDEYTHFYYKWIKPYIEKDVYPGDKNHWQTVSQSSAWFTWAGYAYERVCIKHANIIAKKMGIENTVYHVCDWCFKHSPGSQKNGAQIDMLFDREDEVITIFEIKYSKNKLKIDKPMAKNLANKLMIFEEHYKQKKQITLALITTNGCKESIWSDGLIDHYIDLDDIF